MQTMRLKKESLCRIWANSCPKTIWSAFFVFGKSSGITITGWKMPNVKEPETLEDFMNKTSCVICICFFVLLNCQTSCFDNGRIKLFLIACLSLKYRLHWRAIYRREIKAMHIEAVNKICWQTENKSLFSWFTII